MQAYIACIVRYFSIVPYWVQLKKQIIQYSHLKCTEHSYRNHTNTHTKLHIVKYRFNSYLQSFPPNL